MLYWLADFSDKIQFLNLFRYIAFRTGGALMTGAVFMFIAGLASHLKSKIGTPTMGGLMIIFAVTLSTILWAKPNNPYVWIVLGVTLAFGVIGFYNFSGKLRITTEAIVALLACLAISQLGRPAFATSLVLVLGAFIIVGAGNAVNLTDGLYGLAVVPVMLAALSFGLIAYLAGNTLFADYLQIHYVAGTGELAVLCGAVTGAGLGFLWFNAPPASIFMGDTGSLALGGLIGAVAVATTRG